MKTIWTERGCAVTEKNLVAPDGTFETEIILEVPPEDSGVYKAPEVLEVQEDGRNWP